LPGYFNFNFKIPLPGAGKARPGNKALGIL
jgi:hypothetical protein